MEVFTAIDNRQMLNGSSKSGFRNDEVASGCYELKWGLNARETGEGRWASPGSDSARQSHCLKQGKSREGELKVQEREDLIWPGDWPQVSDTLRWPHFFFVVVVIFLCVWEFGLHVCAPWVWVVPSQTSRGHLTPWNWNYSCELSWGCWELNPRFSGRAVSALQPLMLLSSHLALLSILAPKRMDMLWLGKRNERDSWVWLTRRHQRVV